MLSIPMDKSGLSCLLSEANMQAIAKIQSDAKAHDVSPLVVHSKAVELDELSRQFITLNLGEKKCYLTFFQA